ncbi:MAG TPA: helix-turn-helix domain-containing protein [Flexivirga sp.]|uniref:winged helix-turn-helix transcriptional regulator n=1 Tax=Flexivirga sp. TaxID=1962927 RepID=UPI002B895BB8|nr:helix-turn-helix domain-containing protein [Flexivirga sp.]HWC22830.1 helix-turn-helix domain-containing protein [Flexivirga sp.]
MKSYNQYCTVARALDVVGDRWVLLIVRELLTFGPSRYSDLKRGLPGIATNLLAERLKTMESDGLIEHRVAPAPVGSPVYELTDRGRALDDVLSALTRWGLPTMPSGPSANDAVQPQWTALFAGLTLHEGLAPDQRITLGIRTDGGAVRVALDPDGFAIERGLDDEVDVTLAGPDQLVGGVLAGLLTVREAKDLGLEINGGTALLADLVTSARTKVGDRG